MLQGGGDCNQRVCWCACHGCVAARTLRRVMLVRCDAMPRAAAPAVLLLQRFRVPDEDFESARKAFEGPKRFADVLREAGTKAATEHRQFEAELKRRRKEFDEQVQQHIAKLAVVEGRSDIIKREVAVAEVRWGQGGGAKELRCLLGGCWVQAQTCGACVIVAVVCLQATELQSKLQAAVQTAEEINTQEKMFGWGCTK